MNVLYVGVDNPLSISVAGVPSEQIELRGRGITLSAVGGGKYITKPTRVGTASITVSGGGLQPTTFDYRVKRIPDPIVKLGRKNGGNMSPAEFKAHRGIIPHLESFDFDARCLIQSFEIARVPKNGDMQVLQNNGGTYGSRAHRLVQRASRNDVYYFSEVKCTCPGDVVNRTLGGMVFTIR